MPGKYASGRDEALDILVSAGWATASDGDVSSATGHFARVSNTSAEVGRVGDFGTICHEFKDEFEDIDFNRSTLVGHFLVMTDDQGFCNVAEYDTEAELVAAYSELEKTYSFESEEV